MRSLRLILLSFLFLSFPLESYATINLCERFPSGTPVKCSDTGGATSLTGLSDVGSADPTIGHILVADGTKFQSTGTPMSVRTDLGNVGIGTTVPADTLHISSVDLGGITINASASGIGGIDANTFLMLHMDGSDGSTTFTDSSQSGLTATPVGQTQIDTAAFKFGGASGLFDGTGDTLDYADDDVFFLGGGNGNWTVDLWFNSASAASNQGIFSQRVDPNHFYQFNWGGSGTFRYSYKDGGTQENYDFSPATVLDNTWYHLALVRYNDNMLLFLNGTQIGSTLPLTTTSQTNFTATFHIGTLNGLDFNGHMDEFRISNSARFTGNFTPASSAYTNSGGGQPTIKFKSNDTLGWTIGQDGTTTGADSFKIGHTNLTDTKVDINTSGNVGIGTTNPVKTLHVAGSARITGLSACSSVTTNFSGDLSCGSAGATSLTGLSDVGTPLTHSAGAILIADGTNYQGITTSGDTTMTSAGVVTIGANKVSTAKLTTTGVSAGTYSSSEITVGVDGRINHAASGSLTGLTDVSSATKTAGNILIANGTNFVSTSVSTAGDATLTSAGVLTIQANKVTSAKMTNTGVSAGTYGSANITVDSAGRLTNASAGSLTGISDIGSATVTAGNYLVADGTKFQSVAMTGDITQTSAGVTTIGANKVTSAKMTNTGVSANTYSATNLTVDSAGRITNAASGSLTGLTDIGTATATAGNLLVADGTKFQSVVVDGDLTLTSNGNFSIGANKVGPTQLASTAVTAGSYSSTALTVDADGRITNAASGSLTGLTDVATATKTNGNLLIADGTNFRSTAMSGDATIVSAGTLTVGNNKITTAKLATTGVTAGTYSSSAITVGVDGRINSAASGSLTGLTDVGSATKTVGSILVADGTNFQSVNAPLDVRTDTGNVGVGYTNPGTKLAVNGNVGIGVSVAANSLIVGTGNVGIGYTAPAAILSVNGNVGIGTSAAAHDLDIVSAATSVTGLSDVGNSLTIGGLANFSSSSTDTSTRNLVEITNSGSGAVGAVPLKITQNSSAPAMITPNVYGSIASGGLLTLNSTSHATKGTIDLDDQIRIWPSVPTISSGKTIVTVFPNNFSTGANATIGGVSFSPTITATATPFAFLYLNFFVFSPTIQQDSGNTRTLGPVIAYVGSPIFSANNAALTLSGVNDGYTSAPTFTRTGTPTGSTGNWLAFTSGGPTVGTGWTIDPYVAFDAAANAGAGTLTNNYGLRIGALTGTNVFGIDSTITSGTAKFFIHETGGAKSSFSGNVGIGTTAPGALLTVSGGHIHTNGTAPTIANNACGTTVQGTVTTKSTDVAGQMTVGTLAVTSCAMTFNATWTNAPFCTVADDTNIIALKAVSTTTTLTVSSVASMSSDKISYLCIGGE